LNKVNPALLERLEVGEHERALMAKFSLPADFFAKVKASSDWAFVCQLHALMQQCMLSLIREIIKPGGMEEPVARLFSFARWKPDVIIVDLLRKQHNFNAEDEAAFTFLDDLYQNYNVSPSSAAENLYDVACRTHGIKAYVLRYIWTDPDELVEATRPPEYQWIMRAAVYAYTVQTLGAIYCGASRWDPGKKRYEVYDVDAATK